MKMNEFMKRSNITMSLFTTLHSRISSMLGKVDDHLKDPEADLDLALKQSRIEAQKFQNEISNLSAETKTLEKDLADKQAKKSSYAGMAQKAVDAGNDDDARKILEVIESMDKEIQTLQESVTQNKTALENSRNQLNALIQKIDSAETEKNRLKVRLESATVREGLAQTKSSIAPDSAFSHLADLEKAVQAKEAKAEAVEETVGLEKANVLESLTEKYSGGNSDVEAKLAAMTATAGK
jgi:phage shock protein A